jgi:hypothetical protein
MSDRPDADDYLRLFARYQPGLRDLAPGGEGENYRLLFEQACRMLAQPSSFNAAVPPELRRTAAKWLSGDAATVEQMTDPRRRGLMLSDFYDYVHLLKVMGGARR